MIHQVSTLIDFHVIDFHDLPFHLKLKKDDTVFISSDLNALAFLYKKHGKSININLFIDNLQIVLNEGSIFIPAYTDNLKNGDTFDVMKSKPTTGAISNKDFIRTEDPLHSVFIWGKNADEGLKYNDISTFGLNSIFALLHKINTKFIFIDVHIVNSFTFVHYVEEYLNVFYRKYRKLAIKKINSQSIHSQENILFHTRKPGISTNFDDLNISFRDKGLFTQFKIDAISINIINAKDATIEIENKIKDKKYLYTFSFYAFLKDYLKNIFLFIGIVKK